MRGFDSSVARVSYNHLRKAVQCSAIDATGGLFSYHHHRRGCNLRILAQAIDCALYLWGSVRLYWGEALLLHTPVSKLQQFLMVQMGKFPCSPVALAAQ